MTKAVIYRHINDSCADSDGCFLTFPSCCWPELGYSCLVLIIDSEWNRCWLISSVARVFWDYRNQLTILEKVKNLMIVGSMVTSSIVTSSMVTGSIVAAIFRRYHRTLAMRLVVYSFCLLCCGTSPYMNQNRIKRNEIYRWFIGNLTSKLAYCSL